MISLELIKQINPDDDEAINDALEQLAEELRNMKLNDDFEDINARYDALNSIRRTTVEKLEKMSDEEIGSMIAEDEKNTFYFQDRFIKERHPEWSTEDDEEESDNSEESVNA